MKIDLSQFRRVYLQESAEHVIAMEAGLLQLRSTPQDTELLNAIFRSAHSIKGGAGTFGLTNLVQVTHALENLLDPLRSMTVTVTETMIAVLLESVDVLRVLLEAGGQDAHDTRNTPLPPAAAELLLHIEAVVGLQKEQASAPHGRCLQAVPTLSCSSATWPQWEHCAAAMSTSRNCRHSEISTRTSAISTGPSSC